MVGVFLCMQSCNVAVDEIKSSPVAASAFSHSANELSRSCLFRQFHACGICRARAGRAGWRARTRDERSGKERAGATLLFSLSCTAIGRQEDGNPYGTFSLYCPRTLAGCVLISIRTVASNCEDIR